MQAVPCPGCGCRKASYDSTRPGSNPVRPMMVLKCGQCGLRFDSGGGLKYKRYSADQKPKR